MLVGTRSIRGKRVVSSGRRFVVRKTGKRFGVGIEKSTALSIEFSLIPVLHFSLYTLFEFHHANLIWPTWSAKWVALKLRAFCVAEQGL